MALRKSELTPPNRPRGPVIPGALPAAVFLAFITAGSLPAQPPTAASPEPGSPPQTGDTGRFPEGKPEAPRPPRPRWDREGGPDDRCGGREERAGRFPDRMPKHLRERLESLPPEQREAFRRNWQKWSELPPAERERLRKRQREQMEAARKEIESLIEESGAVLDDAQREKFKRYYISQRRELEIGLMREMEQRRKERLPELRKKLLETLRSGTIPDAPSPAAGKPDTPPHLPLPPAPPPPGPPPTDPGF